MFLWKWVLDRRGKKCRMFSINRLKSRSNGPVAQLGERNVRNVEVRGSSLLRSISERFARMACKTFFYGLVESGKWKVVRTQSVHHTNH